MRIFEGGTVEICASQIMNDKKKREIFQKNHGRFFYILLHAVITICRFRIEQNFFSTIIAIEVLEIFFLLFLDKKKINLLSQLRA